MKYLKLFESFEKLYNNITEVEFTDNDTRTNLHFDDKLIEIIGDRLNSNYTIKVGNEKMLPNTTKYLDVTHYDRNSNWEIWQTSDDWFMVYALYNMDRDDHVGPGEEYFECDTFEGLLQLLEDHSVID